MDQQLLNLLVSRQADLQQIVKEKKSVVKKSSSGSLKAIHRKNHNEYYLRRSKDSKYTYLPKKKLELARVLAQRDYDKKVLKIAKEQLRLVNSLISSLRSACIDDAYTKSPVARRPLIHPVRPSDEEFREEWLKQESCLLGFSKSDPEYYTAKGERVRSKTEIFIANTLLNMNIDYLFECKINLIGHGTVYPDFCVLDLKKRRTIVWEHFGKMHDPDYVERNLRKLNAYLKSGFIIGETLIITFESASHPIDTRYIEKLIRHHFC